MTTAWVYLLGLSLLVTKGEQSSCWDASNSCAAWASQGQCESNRGYMAIQCRKSCRFCGPGKVPRPCRDWDSNCVHWVQWGNCVSDREYMEINCIKACNLCEKQEEESTTAVTTPTTVEMKTDEIGEGDDNDDDDDDDDDNIDDNQPEETIDEIIVNAANSTQEFEYFYDKEGSLLKVEYDMVFTEDEWKERQGSSRRKRTAAIRRGRQGAYRWTNKNIRYEYTPGTFYPSQIRQIQAAMRDWSRYTCLTFSHATTGNRVRFQNSGGCHSRVGMVGGVQVVGLATNCRWRGVVTHELGHAIGLHHEQTRPDRDNYVNIIYRNIPNQVRFNFQRYTWNDILNMGIPYDYLSIMHYSGTAFSLNNGITIQTKDRRYQNIIGNRHKLSFGDIKTVNLMYNCKRATRGCTLTDSQCEGDGFVGKDCKCWCPSPSDSYIYVYCGTTTKPKPKPRPKPGVTKATTPKPETKITKRPIVKVKTGCFDQHRKCAYWAQTNECDKNPSYMLVYCKKSCNVCDKTKETTCKDYHYNCPYWSNYYCDSYRGYMETNCPLSCGKCTSTTTDRTNNCYDNYSYCWYWIPTRYRSCDMWGSYCRKTCGLCS